MSSWATAAFACAAAFSRIYFFSLIPISILAQSPAQFSSLWALREGVTEAVSKEGKPYKYDISVPLSSFKEVVDNTREHLRSKGLLHEKAVKHVLGYGHIGDGM